MQDAANQYAWRQCRGSLRRRGATVVEDGLTVTATFEHGSDAGVAEIALGRKYPQSGPLAVRFARVDDRTLRFEFAAAPGE